MTSPAGSVEVLPETATPGTLQATLRTLRNPLWLVGLVSLVIFFILRPDLIFQNNTPSGGDMGAHVLVPAYLRDNLLPNLRVAGWSNDWFALSPWLWRAQAGVWLSSRDCPGLLLCAGPCVASVKYLPRGGRGFKFLRCLSHCAGLAGRRRLPS